MDKPETLYRGIKIDYNALQNFEFTGVDLVVNYDPIIDKDGRKTVKDGNEYGVYMSDSLNMVNSAYGDLHNDGTSVNKDLYINNQGIKIPDIGIIYEINTDGMEVRKPFISLSLRGHYNNGFDGTEWIADVVPAANYKLNRVRIGRDILHDEEDIDLSKDIDVSHMVKEKIEGRKQRLETFANDMEKLSPSEIREIGDTKLKVLKSIYGENGLKYVDENSLDTKTVDGMVRYLLVKSVKNTAPKIYYEIFKYINELKERATDVDSITKIISDDNVKNGQEKVDFIERKKRNGQNYSTSGFDAKEAKFVRLMNWISYRKSKDATSQEVELDSDIPIPNASEKEEFEWQQIKRKYNYDMSDERRKLLLEEEFRKNIFDRRNKNEIDDKEKIENVESGWKRK